MMAKKEGGCAVFGFVTASTNELTKPQQERYSAVYCGICRQIRQRSSQLSRLGLSYDMAFRALLLMSLYEPAESGGDNACILHPFRHRPWADSEYIGYAADMNVALAYYNALDDCQDDGRLSAKAAAGILGRSLPQIRQRYPRQCAAIENCIQRLSRLESKNCANPDLPAGCFGELMGELLVYHEDLWAPTLRQMGMALGRFIYLTDAAVDYRADLRKKKYNPFLAMQTGEDWDRWEQYLVLAMARCTEFFEKLPLVQDKPLLDNILYSGVWVEFRRTEKRFRKTQEEHND